MTKKVVDGLSIVFKFDDGTEETFDSSRVNDDIKARAMMHGFSQKIGDSYAGAASAENPLAYAKQAVRETIATLYANEWKAPRGEGGPRVTDLAVAVSRVTGKSIEDVVALIEGLSDEDKKALRAKPKVKAALAAISQEKATARAAKLAAAAAEEGDDLGL